MANVFYEMEGKVLAACSYKIEKLTYCQCTMAEETFTFQKRGMGRGKERAKGRSEPGRET